MVRPDAVHGLNIYPELPPEHTRGKCPVSIGVAGTVRYQAEGHLSVPVSERLC